MTVPIRCPNPDCGAAGSIDEASLGRRGRCRKCGRAFEFARAAVAAGAEAVATGAGDSGDASAWKGSPPTGPPSGPAAGATALPERFGRYRIVRPLGRGGMGAVYLAHDAKLGREVALKVPSFAPGGAPQAIRRFEREARAAATLDHPNLCPVFDFGEVDGVPYLTMPYIEGKPLAEAIGRGRQAPEAQAAAIARTLARALQEAHGRGVVHRDLKPGNVLVNRRGELVVVDFGLARLVDADDAPVTQVGHALGTAIYMAPEQALGAAEADRPAVDVYALGVILYELLTGVRPFEGPWSVVIGLKSVRDPEPPSAHRPGLDPALDALCRRALSRDPAGRPAGMAEFADALDDFLRDADDPGPWPDPEPAGPADSAIRILAGIRTGGTTERRATKPAAPTDRPERRWPRRPLLIGLIAGAALLLLGMVIYADSNKGQIKIVVDDPGATVRLDDEEVATPGLGEPITLRAGEHEFTVRRGDGARKTRRFVVGRGSFETLTVEPRPPAGAPPSAPFDSAGATIASLKPEPPAPAPGNPGIGGRADTPAHPPAGSDRKAPPELVVAGRGDWKIDDVGLHQSSRAMGHSRHPFLAFGDPDWSEYDLTLEARKEAGSEGFLILPHWRDQVTFNALGLGIYANRKHAFRTFQDGTFSWVSDTGADEVLIADGRWYLIRMEVRGKYCQCYLDKKLLFEVATSGFDRGRVGLATWDSSVSFRNIRLATPDGRTLFEGFPDLTDLPRIARDGSSFSPRLRSDGPGLDQSLTIFSKTFDAEMHAKRIAERYRSNLQREGGRISLDHFMGRNDVLATHPFSPEEPAVIDFGRITSTSRGRLFLFLRSAPYNGSDGRIIIRKNEEIFHESVNKGVGDWRTVVVPFANEPIRLEHHALDWNTELMFIDYFLAPE